MKYEVKGARPRGRPKKTWRKIVEKACQVRELNREIPWTVLDEADKGRLMTMIGVSG